MNRLSIVEKLINTLNDNSINYCHWKSNEHVHDAFTGVDDIDLLISEDHITKLNVVLNNIGYKRFNLPEKRKYYGIEDYIAYDDKEGIFVHLHLHYNLTLGEKFLKGYQLPYSNKILENRIYDRTNNIFISSYEDEMWLLIIRSALKIRNRDKFKNLLNKPVINKGTKIEFEWLKKRIENEKLITVLPKDLSIKSQKIIIDIANKELNNSKLTALNKNLIKDFRYFKANNRLKSKYLKWSREIFRINQIINKKILRSPKAYRRSPISGGKVISLLGPDGAGKSTLMFNLEKSLSKQFDTEKIYLGSGDGNSSLLRLPLKILYSFFLKRKIIDRKSKKINKDGSFNYTQETKKSSILRQIGEAPWIAVLTSEKISKLKKTWKLKNNGYIVLTDRYPQDQIIGMLDGPRFYKNDQIKSNFINDQIVNHEKKLYDLSNKLNPDLIIVLTVSSEVAMSRKPEEISLESHKNLMHKLLSLKFENSKVVYIDANQDIDEVRKNVMKEVWDIL